jgi:hypothetical protein
VPSLLESLIEERVRSELSFAELALAQPGAISATLRACLNILRASAIITIKEFEKRRTGDSEQGDWWSDEEQEPMSDKEAHDDP